MDQMRAFQTGNSTETREHESTFSVLNPSSRSLRLGSALQVTVDVESLISYFAGELKGILACEASPLTKTDPLVLIKADP